MRGRRAIDDLNKEVEEDWESESETEINHTQIRGPVTPSAGKDPVRKLNKQNS